MTGALASDCSGYGTILHSGYVLVAVEDFVTASYLPLGLFFCIIITTEIFFLLFSLAVMYNPSVTSSIQTQIIIPDFSARALAAENQHVGAFYFIHSTSNHIDGAAFTQIACLYCQTAQHKIF